MTFQSWLLFVLASAALIATPGPNVAMIVGTTLRYGLRTGLLAVVGVNLGAVVQLSAIAAGLSWIVSFFTEHFNIIRYLGAGYLIFLAATQLMQPPAGAPGVSLSLPPERAFGRGLAIAFANPKTLVFHAAFLPLFLNDPQAGGRDLWLLVATFSMIAAVGDVLFALLAAKAGHAVSGRYARLADRVSAVILLGGALVLVLMSPS